MAHQSLPAGPDDEPLDVFGRFVMQHLRDPALDSFAQLASGKSRSPKVQPLQKDLAALGDGGVAVARRALVECLGAAIHSFLFKLQEQADFEDEIQVTVRGTDVVRASDGLHGEPFGKTGWYARFSKYGEPSDKA